MQLQTGTMNRDKLKLQPPPLSHSPLLHSNELRGHPLSTYAPRGRGGSKKTENMRTLLTDRLREKRTRGGEGVKKAGKSAYVLNGCSLRSNFS